MKNFIYIFIFLLPINLFGQQHDNNWLFGSSGQDSLQSAMLGFGTAIINFNNIVDTPHVYYEGLFNIDFDGVNVSMSDEEGNYVFSCNGHYVEDISGEIMENGDSLNAYNPNQSIGYKLPQGAIALPYPNHSNQYILFHMTHGTIEEPDWGPEGVALYYSIIDMEMNGSLGAVVEKKVPLIIDTLSFGEITATRHANGRDWWLLVNESHSNRFYSILITPAGIENVENHATGQQVISGLGQAVFSPDGTKYVLFNTVSLSLGQFIDIYDFDRCTGLLSNHERITYDEDSFSGGAAISSNSRYLYIPSDFFFFNSTYGEMI